MKEKGGGRAGPGGVGSAPRTVAAGVKQQECVWYLKRERQQGGCSGAGRVGSCGQGRGFDSMLSGIESNQKAFSGPNDMV